MSASNPHSTPSCRVCQAISANREAPNHWHDPVWHARTHPRYDRGGSPTLNLKYTSEWHLASMILWLLVGTYGQDPHRSNRHRRWHKKWLARAVAEADHRGIEAFMAHNWQKASDPVAEAKFKEFIGKLSDKDLAEHFISAEKRLNDGEGSDFIGWCVKWITEELDRRSAAKVKVETTPFDPLEHSRGTVEIAMARAMFPPLSIPDPEDEP